MKVEDSVVFVTGANRGLELAIACEAQSRGAAKVYPGVRNVDGFDIGGIAPVKLDVTDRNSIIAAAVSSADTTVLINNAGIGGIVLVGREGGRYSMDQMTEVKWVTVQMGQRQFPF
jgi:NAD(P)-dependent dehydrogenase (short-subunit alcohol dehydrogenase family)